MQTIKTFNNHKLKSIKVNARFFVKLLVFVFILNVIVLPADNFNLKIVSLLLLLIVSIHDIIVAEKTDDKIISFFGAILTSLSIVSSILLTGSFDNIMLGYSGYILLLYFPIKKYRINFEKLFYGVLKWFSIFIVVMMLLDIIHLVDMYNNPILMWFNQTDNAMIGKGSHLSIGYQMFFKTSTLFFVALCHSLKRREFISVILYSLTIIVSGTRANILMLAFTVILYFCFLYQNRRVRLVFRIVCFALAIAILVDGRLVESIMDMFARKASSDEVRDGHLKGIFEFWKEAPIKFLIGSGYSSEFYSYGIKNMTANVELSYWNLLRQVGLFLFIPMMVMYLYPAFKLLKIKRHQEIVLAYVVYLVIAYTNPFLYSSTGMTLLLYMYILYFTSKKEICREKNILRCANIDKCGRVVHINQNNS